MKESEVIVRNISADDDPYLAKIIRDALENFDANLPGTVYFDPTTDHLSNIFTVKGAQYYVAIINDVIVGGGGYFPTDGLPDDTCELVKMYINKDFRGRGIGKLLLHRSIEDAVADGYKYMYLETLPQLNRAVSLYEKNGFEKLLGPMGNSGHFGCNMWMIRRLSLIHISEPTRPY